MDLCERIVDALNILNLLTIFAKGFNLDFWRSPELIPKFIIH